LDAKRRKKDRNPNCHLSLSSALLGAWRLSFFVILVSIYLISIRRYLQCYFGSASVAGGSQILENMADERWESKIVQHA
jgi:hypothetical protein